MTPKTGDRLPGFSATLSKFDAAATLKFSSLCPPTMAGSLDESLGTLPGISPFSLSEWGTFRQRDHSYTRPQYDLTKLLSVDRHRPLA